MNYITFFDTINLQDVAQFGGKNASLGEMIGALSAQGIRVPFGFATSAQAYWHHLESNNLLPTLKDTMAQLHDIQDLNQLHKVAAQLRTAIIEAPFPADFEQELLQAYQQLSRRYDPSAWCDVAVRSSATAEDLPGASFAGQQETYLHVVGDDELLNACKKCMASLFTERAIVYRRQQGIGDFDVALSVGIQKMVRSDTASAGVMFTIDTETGFEGVIGITSAYGLGELVVQGRVNPDEFCVHKATLAQGFRPIIKKYLGSKQEKLTNMLLCPVALKDQQAFSLSDDEVLELGRSALVIEQHYSQLHGRFCPMDIEWAKDGGDGKLYIVQARPETVHSKKKRVGSLEVYKLTNNIAPEAFLTSGQGVGAAIVSGRARCIERLTSATDFEKGDILVTDMTDPDWTPLMKKAAGIITNRGGRTCHAAIVSRELGIPAVVGTERATEIIKDGQMVTIDCSQGARGVVYDGVHAFERAVTDLAALPQLPVEVLVNIGNPDSAFRTAALPVAGVGLARLEFIIASIIKIHPMAVVASEKIIDADVARQIAERAHGYPSVREFFVATLAHSIGMIAAAFYPRQVTVRLSDFKSNEYRDLLGGAYFEPVEENPMLGFRGAVRYRNPGYAPAFALECEALLRARVEMGLTNIRVMVPFVRTVEEACEVVEVLERNGLKRGMHGLVLLMMVEVPSNVLLLEDFSRYFDGFSIGSNDLAQLTLGVDRDSGSLAKLFDERDPAVKKIISMAIHEAKQCKKYIGICGQAPSDFPDFAQFLMREGINSISLTPDAVIPFLQKN